MQGGELVGRALSEVDSCGGFVLGDDNGAELGMMLLWKYPPVVPMGLKCRVYRTYGRPPVGGAAAQVLY